MNITKQELRNKHLQQEIDRFNEYNQLGERLSLKLDLFIEVLNTFENQGHSGFSANYCFSYLEMLTDKPEETLEKLTKMVNEDASDELQSLITDNILEIYNLISDKPLCIQKAIITLLQGDPLTPLTGEEDEWVEDTILTNRQYKVYTNKRCHRVQKNVMPDGIEICTYSNHQIFSDNGGHTFFSTYKFGRVQITFPFVIPEAEKVYLYEVEGQRAFILTDPKTIEQVRQNYLTPKEVKFDEV